MSSAQWGSLTNQLCLVFWWAWKIQIKATLIHKDFIRYRILPISVNGTSEVPRQNTHHLPRYFAPGVALKHDWCVLINFYLLRSAAHTGVFFFPVTPHPPILLCKTNICQSRAAKKKKKNHGVYQPERRIIRNMWTPEAKLNFVSQSMCEKKKLKRCHLHIKTGWNQLKIAVFPLLPNKITVIPSWTLSHFNKPIQVSLDGPHQVCQRMRSSPAPIMFCVSAPKAKNLKLHC